jgi:hypothetical protein
MVESSYLSLLESQFLLLFNEFFFCIKSSYGQGLWPVASPRSIASGDLGTRAPGNFPSLPLNSSEQVYLWTRGRDQWSQLPVEIYNSENFGSPGVQKSMVLVDRGSTNLIYFGSSSFGHFQCTILTILWSVELGNSRSVGSYDPRVFWMSGHDPLRPSRVFVSRVSNRRSARSTSTCPLDWMTDI